jgi:alpha-glucosidase (family GH31 glycosyl hydrolase)
MLRSLKERGDKAVIHAGRGRPSNRKLALEVEQRAIEILSQEVYQGFGPSLRILKRFITRRVAAFLKVLICLQQVTGFPHMPPLWALGYQQSHRTLSSSGEVLDEAKKFRQDKLPCDTMIYLGTGFCPSGWNTGHGSFAFNKKIFPDPKQIIQELHNEHFHVALHLTKPPQHLQGRVADAGSTAEDFSDAAHYWATHLDVFRLGVAERGRRPASLCFAV